MCNTLHYIYIYIIYIYIYIAHDSLCKDGRKHLGRVASRKDEDEMQKLKILCEGSGVQDLSKLKVLR